MNRKTYLLSLPERLIRSALGLGAGIVREAGDVALPDSIRGSQLYQNLVGATLRFVIEQVGGVENVYASRDRLPDDFLVRRTAGNAVELLGIAAFSASPVWILAGLADLSGLGRQLMPEIADALKAQGLLEPDAEFTNVDQLLDGLERTSSRLASTVNTPPLDVASLREEWTAIRDQAKQLPAASLPSADRVRGMWSDLKSEAARQNQSVFYTSSLMAMAAARALPDNIRWLAASVQTGTLRAGKVVAADLLDYYQQTLDELRATGYAAFAKQQLMPYVRAAMDQFSPARRTLTERLIDKVRNWRRV